MDPSRSSSRAGALLATRLLLVRLLAFQPMDRKDDMAPGLERSFHSAMRAMRSGAGFAVRRGWQSLGALLLLTASACSSTASPPCAASTVVTGCHGGAAGYSCAGGATPDPSLGCGNGMAGPTGDTYYCCGGAAGTCMVDPTVPCAGTSRPWSCTGVDSPSTMHTTYACTVGLPIANGVTAYCCLANASSTCSPNATVQGCADDSFGFSCSGTDTPAQANTLLTCGPGVAGNGGLTLYCCQ